MKFVASREDRGIVAIVQHLFTGSSSKRFLKTILAQRDDLSPSSKTTQKPTKIHEIWQNDHKTTCGSEVRTRIHLVFGTNFQSSSFPLL